MPRAASTRILPATAERRVRAAYRSLLFLDPGTEPHLRAVVQHVLAHPGRLLRAQMAYGIASGSGVNGKRAVRLAVAVEYFHSASLVFDDMPAMDDATRRRGQPCPHILHGEGAAILGALALITRGYAVLWEAIGPLPPAMRSQAARLVGECLGASGILDGQARDLHFPRRSVRAGEILAAQAGKTVPLIRLALVLPALVAGADAKTVARLESLAASWGAAYQILDDFNDELMTDAEAGKTTARDIRLGRPSLPARIGTREAFVWVERLLGRSATEIAALEARHPGRWAVLRALQSLLENARDDAARRITRSAVA